MFSRFALLIFVSSRLVYDDSDGDVSVLEGQFRVEKKARETKTQNSSGSGSDIGISSCGV